MRGLCGFFGFSAKISSPPFELAGLLMGPWIAGSRNGRAP